MRPRLTYANVVASLALFLALGGAAYAATQLPKNSVGSTQIRNGSVTSADVKNDSLTAGDLKAGAGAECPAGTKLAAGACIETSAHPAASYGFALIACAGEGRRLPSQGELAAYDSFQYSGNQTTPREWVEPSWTDGGERANYVIALKNGALGFGSEDVNTQYQFRCAT